MTIVYALGRVIEKRAVGERTRSLTLKRVRKNGKVEMAFPTGWFITLSNSSSHSSSSHSSPDLAFQRLRELRPILLKFHKALLEAERHCYEQVNGPIRSKGAYFQLVISHEWFSWLRPISQFIVRLDEALMARTPPPPETFQTLLAEARALLQTSETGTVLKERYQLAVQHDPTISAMQVKVMELLEEDS